MHEHVQVELAEIRSSVPDRVTTLDPTALRCLQEHLDVLGRSDDDSRHRFGADGDPSHPRREIGNGNHVR
jgi:hypothetical protein